MTAPLPLAGVRVTDLSQNLAGPYATQILADLGADVIKVEPPGGDPARRWGPPFVDGQSPLFLCANRGKRSIVLDLKTDAGREALRRLAASSRVFVQAFRTGVAESLGFGYDAVRSIRDDVVYVSVTAFGQTGPRRDEPGYDPLMQAFGGIMSVTGEPGGEPVRVGTSVVDFGTGVWTALGVLAALARTPPAARHVSTALLDTTVALMAYHLQGHLATDAVPGPMGSGLGMIAPYEAFRTADGRVMIAAANDAIFGRLCGALDLRGLLDDPRFADNPGRVEHRDALRDRLLAMTTSMTSEDLLERLRAAAVPCAPIQDVADVARDTQVAASGMLAAMPAAGAGYYDVATPIRWDGARPAGARPPPRPGEHTDEILAELEQG